MKWFRLFAFFTFATAYCVSVAQTQIQNVTADYLRLDPYGNIYAVKDAQLFKISPQGKLLYSYTNFSFGTISSIDVFNPMKIMLFYQNSGLLVFLNEQLAPIHDPISLHDAGYFTISLASYSSANQIHLFDNSHRYLISLDFFMNEISRTPVHFQSFNPIHMIELEEKKIALHDPNCGVFFFDSFGTFNKLIHISTHHYISITSEFIYYTQNDEIHLVGLKNLNTEIQPLPVSDVVQTLLYKNNMILLRQNGTIWIY